MDWDRDHDYCADAVRSHDPDRWLTAAIAPADARARLIALYGFNVEIARIPDLVSEPMLGQIRLQWWREAISEADRGNIRDHPALRALTPMIKDKHLNAANIIAFLDARESDLDPEAPESLPELEAYCWATGGALSALALDALEVESDSANEAAIKIGTAHGLIGQLRNTPWQAARGRVSLPGEILTRHGITPQSILSGKPEGNLGPAAREIADRAKELISEARTHQTSVPGKAVPVLILARIIEGQIAQLARANFDLFSNKAEPLPYRRPLAVLLGALTRRY